MLYVCGKRMRIRAARNAHTRSHTTQLERCDDRLIRWSIARYTRISACPNRRPTVAACQVQITAELIYDHQIVCIQLADLDLKQGSQPRIALAGPQRLFFREKRKRLIERLRVQRESERPCSRDQVSRCSGKVASGVASS